MIETLILLTGVFVGYHIGQLWTIFKLKDFIQQSQVQISKATTESEDSTYSDQLIIECHDDILYLFNEHNDFICQADNISKLAELAKQYKNISEAYVLDTRTDKIYKFVNGKVE